MIARVGHRLVRSVTAPATPADESCRGVLPGGGRSWFGVRPLAVAVLALLTLTCTVYAPLVTHEFIFLDDSGYLLDNPQVRQGFTRSSVIWAFTTFHEANWHPLTWLSHMLDVELFGMNPRGHHVASLLFHGAAATALLLVFNAMTGLPGASFWLASFFAIHPLRVESVAWAAERKDVLSALLWMLTLAAYLWYARKPGGRRYLTTVVLFALGLLAKPMVVTLPVVLLLLDYWPLGRMRGASTLTRLALEKLPLLTLSGLSALVTIKAQQAGEAVLPMSMVPLSERMANAVVAPIAYLAKTLWPEPLSIYYPRHPGGPQPVILIAAGVLLLLVTAAAVNGARRRPYFLSGWCWYLTALLPVSGLVQVGEQAVADRYTYLPSVGLAMVWIWALREISGERSRLRAVLTIGSVCLLVVWGSITSCYLGRWKDGITLFEHALEVTRGNWMAHLSLGGEYARRGRIEEAIEQFSRGLAIQPSDAEGHYNLGHSYHLLGNTRQAELQYRRALTLRPELAQAHNNLGVILSARGDLRQALTHFRESLRIKPDLTEARQNLDRTLAATRGRR